MNSSLRIFYARFYARFQAPFLCHYNTHHPMNSSTIIQKIWPYSHVQRDAALQQAILQRAFSGRLAPQKPEDEPAGELLEQVRAVARANSSTERILW